MKQVFEKVTNDLIDQLKKIQTGEIEAHWFRPWTTSGMPQYPTNQATGAQYKGINALLLHMSAIGHGFRTNRWVTFKQKDKLNEELDAHMMIRKGEHGYPIFKYVEWLPKGVTRIGSMPGKVMLNGRCVDEKAAQRVTLRQYMVFNIDQMKDVPPEYQVVEEEPDWDKRYAGAWKFVHSLPCPMEHSEIDKAYYVPSSHLIRIPQAKAFKDETHYLATIFHEHVHSTGKECERDMTGEKGTDRYAKEELVAEIGSAILCAHFGIEAPVQHPEYINGYIKQLKDSDRAFWNAANKAQKAVNLLMDGKV